MKPKDNAQSISENFADQNNGDATSGASDRQKIKLTIYEISGEQNRKHAISEEMADKTSRMKVQKHLKDRMSDMAQSRRHHQFTIIVFPAAHAIRTTINIQHKAE